MTARRTINKKQTMKKITMILGALLLTVISYAQEVKFKVTNSDPVTGKRMIVFLTNAPIGAEGYPLQIQYLVKLKEADETTDAAPADGSIRAKRAVETYEESFFITDRKINSTTLLYLPDDTTDPNAITLKEYFRTKVISSFPGVGGGDPFRDIGEGLLRQMVAIRQANGEMPL